jgi:translation initiation factor IF-2
VDIVSFEDAIFYSDIETLDAKLSDRAPVVTVMGHVDHGKTTLLDTLRDTHTAEKEAGGITQKIGAYKLHANNADIVFLDTPGHEAFTNIRARGAKVTDIVILVVAANDGVKPQTIEAINHAKAADVPIVVAINKIDLPGANPDKVKQELAQRDVVVENWGGQVVSVEISAKQNQNLDSLLEMITLQAEILELKAYQDIPARGTIIESRLDPQLGPMGTVLIQHGQVKRGDFFICGDAVGKVKSIFDDQGTVQDNARVPLPVEIMGFENVPEAGERFQVVTDVEKARKVIDMRKQKEKEARNEEVLADKKLSLQNLFERLEENKTKVFPIVIKSDNFSSGEVLENILLKQSREKLKINIIHQGIGNITESDILLASTSDAIILGFNVKAPQKILNLAKQEQIQIRLYNVIYHLIEDIEKAIKGEIEPEYVETHIGTVEVLQIFKISKIGVIAGCLVKEGKVTNKSTVKTFRKDALVFEGEIENLKRVKNDVAEVKAGTECGIRIKNFNAVEVGDMLEIYEKMVKE